MIMIMIILIFIIYIYIYIHINADIASMRCEIMTLIAARLPLITTTTVTTATTCCQVPTRTIMYVLPYTTIRHCIFNICNAIRICMILPRSFEKSFLGVSFRL